MCKHDANSYEYAEPLTIGGLTGQFSLRSPFPQGSEVAVLSVAFTDTGYVLVSPDANPVTLSQATAIGQQLRGIAFSGALAGINATPDALFWPLGPDQTIYASVSVANAHAAFITVLFRRLPHAEMPAAPLSVAPEHMDAVNILREQRLTEQEAARLKAGKVRR